VILVILLIALIVLGVLIGLGKIKLPTRGNDSDDDLKEDNDTDVVIQDGELSIHFLELGNYYAGDSVYIKAGDIDILIDAGSRASSATTIHNYIKQYCTDGKLEYVIATHAHEDHISGFVGTNSNPGIFDLYECDVIIDYAFKNTSSQISKNYEAKRDKEVTLGAKHYTAKDCMEGNNGATSKYKLTESISFEILDQRYYYESSSDENNYSVCMMLNYGDNHFLFTGDLEKEGEESLVEKNKLPHCKVFKGGHHGSKTSSNEALLAAITPEVVCVCCCAGSSEYTDNVDNMFPTQDFINRVARYTNRVYVTTLAKYTIATNKEGHEYPKVNGFESMNGNIVVTLNSSLEVVVNCSNNQTVLKETEWFNSTIVLNGESRKMRTWPEGGK
ncbi:MAG: MBL fold metallo-hydrolase, partial [Anaeroplasmataceae bacterium]|nr:MBL fold metallo-hydrolase [Anaeroplasmataceae bacterium]